MLRHLLTTLRRVSKPRRRVSNDLTTLIVSTVPDEYNDYHHSNQWGR